MVQNQSKLNCIDDFRLFSYFIMTSFWLSSKTAGTVLPNFIAFISSEKSFLLETFFTFIELTLTVTYFVVAMLF